MEQILPVLDTAKLQEKANEFAMKGAEESLKEFYTGYKSPYKEAIENDLKSKQINGIIELPDILAVVNNMLSDEVTKIANEAVAKSFIPMVGRFLHREDKEINFSEILRKFIEETRADDYYDAECTVEKNTNYDWYNVNISFGDYNYELTLHEDWESKKTEKKMYKFISLPRNTASSQNQKMKVRLTDGAELEMPFVREVLSDPFTAYIGRLVLSGSLIKIDVTEFDEEMFHKDCHC